MTLKIGTGSQFILNSSQIYFSYQPVQLLILVGCTILSFFLLNLACVFLVIATDSSLYEKY